MAENLRIRDADLGTALDAITRTRWDFDSIGGRCDDLSAAVGHDRLGRVIDNFADSWRIRRKRLSEDLLNLEGLLRGTIETFDETDKGIQKSLESGQSQESPGHSTTQTPSSHTPPSQDPPEPGKDTPAGPDSATVPPAAPIPMTDPGPGSESTDAGRPAEPHSDSPPVAAGEGEEVAGDADNVVPSEASELEQTDRLGLPQTPAFRSLVQTLEGFVARIEANPAAAGAAVAALGGVAIAALAAAGKLPEGLLASWLSSVRSTATDAAVPTSASRARDLLGRPVPGDGVDAGDASAVPVPAPAAFGPQDAAQRLAEPPIERSADGVESGSPVAGRVPLSDPPPEAQGIDAIREPVQADAHGLAQVPPVGGPSEESMQHGNTSGPGPAPVVTAPPVVGGIDPLGPSPAAQEGAAPTATPAGPDRPESRTSANASLLGMGAMSSLAAAQSAGGANRPKADDHERLAEAKRLLGRASEKGPTP